MHTALSEFFLWQLLGFSDQFVLLTNLKQLRSNWASLRKEMFWSADDTFIMKLNLYQGIYAGLAFHCFFSSTDLKAFLCTLIWCKIKVHWNVRANRVWTWNAWSKIVVSDKLPTVVWEAVRCTSLLSLELLHCSLQWGVTFCSCSYMEAGWGVTIYMAPIHQGHGLEQKCASGRKSYQASYPSCSKTFARF